MTDAPGIWQYAKAEVRSWPQRPTFWWLMVLAPALCFGVLWLLLGSGNLRNLPMALCDQDGTPLSRQVTRWVDATPSMHVAYVVSNPDDGNAMLRAGKVYGFILIPRNFERDVLRKRPVRIIAYIEGQHMTTAGILSRDLSALGVAFWRQQDIQMRENSGIPGSSAFVQSSTVALDLRPIANPSINYRLFLLPGLLPALLQLVMSIATVYGLSRLSQSTMPQPRPWKAVVGTVAPFVGWFWLLGCGISSLLILSGDLILQGSFAVLALAYFLFTLASIALGIILFGVTDTLIQSLSVVSAFSSPAFAFSGLTFPLASMPLLGRMWAALLPITHLLKIQVACGQMGSTMIAQAPSFLALILLFVGCGVAGIPLAALRIGRHNANRSDDPALGVKKSPVGKPDTPAVQATAIPPAAIPSASPELQALGGDL